MAKKLIIGIVVLSLIIAAVFYMKRKDNSPLVGSQPITKTISEASEWANAIKSGKPTSCVMVRGEDKMEYYIEGKKMRADITTTLPEAKTGAPTTSLSHMINDGNYLYSWSEGQLQGSKISLLIPSPSPVNSSAQKEETPNFENESSYDNLKTEGYTINCNSIVADPSRLSPPSDINFIDPTEMMKKIAPTEGNSGIDVEKLQEMAEQYQQ